VITRAEVANGPVDVLINNAALMVPGPLVHMTAEDVRTIVTVNTIAPLELARGAMKTMIERRHGSIVNVTSLAGHLAVRNIIPYCSSKAALTTATEALRREVAGTGVHARLVVLGYVATDMMDESHAEPVAKAQAIRLGRLPVAVDGECLGGHRGEHRTRPSGHGPAAPGYATAPSPTAAAATCRRPDGRNPA